MANVFNKLLFEYQIARKCCYAVCVEQFVERKTQLENALNGIPQIHTVHVVRTSSASEQTHIEGLLEKLHIDDEKLFVYAQHERCTPFVYAVH